MHYDMEAIRHFLTEDTPDPTLSAHLCICADCRRLYEHLRAGIVLFESDVISTGLTLMPEQWIYCAALIGGSAFEGLPDVLSHINDSSRGIVYAKAQDSLVNKGLIEVSFDGTVGIKKRLYDIVDACVNFERYLSLLRKTPGKPERVCNVYEKDGNSVVMYVDIRKGCTAVNRTGKVFFEDIVCRSAESIPLSLEEFCAMHEDVKGFEGYIDSDEIREALMLAMSGSAEYYSITEIITNPGKMGRFYSGTLITTYDSRVEIAYDPKAKAYMAGLNRDL